MNGQKAAFGGFRTRSALHFFVLPLGAAARTIHRQSGSSGARWLLFSAPRSAFLCSQRPHARSVGAWIRGSSHAKEKKRELV